MLLDVQEHLRVIWSDQYGLPLLDAIGKADVEMTIKLVSRLDPAILFTEAARHGSHDPADATGLIVRAIPMLHSYDRPTHDEAGAMLSMALENAPSISMAHAWRAFWHMGRLGQKWSSDPDAELLEAERQACASMRLDPENALAMGIYGHVCSFYRHDFDRGRELLDRALILNPSLAYVWALSAATSCYTGRIEQARFRLRRYHELAPIDSYSNFFDMLHTTACLMEKNYHGAVSAGRRCIRENPDFTNGYKPLLSALGHLGMADEAATVLAALLERDPKFCLAEFRANYPFEHQADREHYIDGMRMAGAPATVVISQTSAARSLS